MSKSYLIIPTIIVFICVGVVRADQVYPPGDIGNATWSADEVISIAGSVTIIGSVSAASGVHVQVAPDAIITIQGSLVAAGTAANPVRFEGTPALPPNDFWGGIKVVSGGELSLDHAVVTHARRGIFVDASSLTMRHSAITDIVGEPGADGIAGGNGGNGNGGEPLYGVQIQFNSTSSITDCVIDGVTGGAGGIGGSLDPQAGNGGNGGSAAGVRYYAMQTAPSTVFERNVIANIASGAGGQGGSGVVDGTGGSGGGAGVVNGINLDYGPHATFRNVLIHHLTSTASGAGGFGGGLGGFGGPRGSRSYAAGVNMQYTDLVLEHFTIDSVGGLGSLETDGISTYDASDPALGLTIQNCSISNLTGMDGGVFSLSKAGNPGMSAIGCNLFTAGDIRGLFFQSGITAFDPAFVDAAAGDYHLAPASPLVDLGQPTLTTVDLEGQLRDATPDLGADELGTYVGRAVGDFDNSYCTDLNDFLTLLDLWATDLDGTVVGLADFLALLDNWQTGIGCS